MICLSVLTPVFQNRLQRSLRVSVRTSRWSIIRWRYNRSLRTVLWRPNFPTYSRHFVFAFHGNGFASWSTVEVTLWTAFRKRRKGPTSDKTWSLAHEVERFVDHTGRPWIRYPRICLNGLSRWRISRICFTETRMCKCKQLLIWAQVPQRFESAIANKLEITKIEKNIFCQKKIVNDCYHQKEKI